MIVCIMHAKNKYKYKPPHVTLRIPTHIPCEHDAAVGVELLEDLRRSGLLVLDAMAFIAHHNLRSGVYQRLLA